MQWLYYEGYISGTARGFGNLKAKFEWTLTIDYGQSKWEEEGKSSGMSRGVGMKGMMETSLRMGVRQLSRELK